MGQPAARAGDAVIHQQAAGAVLQGLPSVLVGDLPAARQGDLVQHNNGLEAITEGEPTVLIGGMPAARMGDRVTCEGAIAVGCTTVWIGLSLEGECLKDAGEHGVPFVSRPET